uniref:Uncharacterized protein n=1 Tax=Vespula pensylvanica TaxID=30213 RepID=A0A834P5E7_VESPE|nr:hypothetical protein H0235_007295 [Vespula pensylvanica]
MAEQVPNEDQVILLDNIDGITNKEYIDVIAQIIGLDNIKHILRNINEPVQIFLSDKEIVDNLLYYNNTVNIGMNYLRIRPLVPRSKRIILFDVYPTIPSFIIERELMNLNIQLTSQITFMQQNDNPNYGHIFGSNREMYIRLEDVLKLPEVLEIQYKDTKYLICLSIDITTTKEEHTRNYTMGTAKRKVSNITDGENNERNITCTSQFKDTNESINFQNAPIRNSISDPQPSTSQTPEVIILSPNPQLYTNLSSTSSPSLVKDNCRKVSSKMKGEKVKSTKVKRKIPIPKLKLKYQIYKNLLPAKQFIMKNTERYGGLHFQNIYELICDTFRNPKGVFEIVANYRADILTLIDLLSNVKDYVTERSLKSRINKITDYLKKKRT